MSKIISKYFPVARPDMALRTRRGKAHIEIKYEAEASVGIEPERKVLKRPLEEAVVKSKQQGNDLIKEESVSAGEVENKVHKWEPKDWKKVVENIAKMRSDTVAAVDTMGCHKCHDEEVSPETKRFQMLVALMLSSQTKDTTTFAVMQKLKAAGLSTKRIIEMSVSELEQIIKPCNFYKRKTVFIKGAAQFCEDEHNGDIPSTVDGLCRIKGVGPKMAHLAMHTAWGVVTGIAVDTHVHRIAHRLGWVKNPCKEPTKTQTELESWLPHEYWRDINHLLVGLGQTICSPRNPQCKQCLNNKLCPTGKKTVR